MNLEAPLDGLTIGDLRTLVDHAVGLHNDDPVLVTRDPHGEPSGLMVTGVSLPGGIITDARETKRRRLTPEFLAEVAEVYNDDPEAPTKAVQETFDVARPTASRWVAAARTAGLITPQP